MTRHRLPIGAAAAVVLALAIMGATIMGATDVGVWSGPAGADVRSGMAPSTTSIPRTPDTFPDQTVPKVSIPSIIPLPNSGVAPKSATDRGGWAQYAVLSGIVVALGVIFLLIVRESRTKKRAQLEATAGVGAEAAETRSSTRNEPVTDTSVN